MAHVSIEISIDLGQKSYLHISLKSPDSGLKPLNGFDFYFDMA